MIDPDNITLPVINQQHAIVLKDVPEYDFLVWDLESDKDLKKYFKTIENEVRHSFEYKEYIPYIKEHYGLNHSAFEKISCKDNRAVKIEIHHFPYSLYDIVNIVYHKRCYYQEPLEVQMVAREVMMLHYKLLVGLISVTETEHQLMHEGKLFFPVTKIFGRWKLFEDLYKQWIGSDLLDTTQRMIEYSDDNSELLKTLEILQPNHIHYEYTENNPYSLPNFNNLQNNMQGRLLEIKNNNYKLPTIDEIKDVNRKDDIRDRRSIISPIYFF